MILKYIQHITKENMLLLKYLLQKNLYKCVTLVSKSEYIGKLGDTIKK